MTMQSAKDFLKAEADKKLADATAITDAASDAARSLTPDERKSVEGLLAEAQQFKSRIQDMDDNQKILDAIESQRGPVNQPPSEAPAGSTSLGDAFVKSDAYKGLSAGFKTGSMTGRWTSGPIEIPDFVGGTKATITSTASPITQVDTIGGIREAAAVALRRLTVADLLAQGTTDSATVRYLQETTNTNAAAAVDEGAAKPESTITFTQVDEPVRKVATFLPVSDEMLEDVAQLRSYLDNRLRLFVQHAEESNLLLGDGTAPNISGILDRSGLQTGTRSALGVLTGETAGSTTIANALYRAITNIRVNALVEPDGIVMHPTNWAALRLAKDSAGQYLGGGPMIGAYGNGIMTGETAWGLPVVVTSAITANTALVGAFGTMAQVFYRNGLTVEASNSHDDFFQKNLTAIRAEQRLALAVYRPSAFHAITALQTP
jgi:HK97 family phage major capsid protein